eukprot:g7113.t1
MSKYKCVADLVEHIYSETKAVMELTHGDNWYFYHGALSLMTAASTRAWMEEKGILKHWWLPMEGLNDWSKEYKNRPVGNSPEMMLLGTSLNKDVHDSVSYHAALTDKLAIDNPKKFARDTPSRLVKSYMRVWRGGGRGAAPAAARISQGCKKFVSSCWAIFKVKGVVVQGLGDRNGNRAVEGRKGRKDARGGLQVKGEYSGSRWTHSDASEAEDLFFETAKKAKKEEK